MSLTITLPPELEAKLHERARDVGVEASKLVVDFVQQGLGQKKPKREVPSLRELLELPPDEPDDVTDMSEDELTAFLDEVIHEMRAEERIAAGLPPATRKRAGT